MRLIDADILLQVLQSYDTSAKLWPGIERAIFHIKDAYTIDVASATHKEQAPYWWNRTTEEQRERIERMRNGSPYIL